MRSLGSAASGMMAQQFNVEVISNNIANMNTTGFKRARVEFADLLYQTISEPGAASTEDNTIVPTGIQVGVGVKTATTYRIHSQGALTQTDNPLDVAISGRGFFQVQYLNGETGYTRNGNFLIDPNGQLTTAEGYPLLPQMAIPENAQSVTINASGQVQVTIDGQANPTTLGQIQLALFTNEAGLRSTGSNIFVETAASGNANVGAPGSPGYGTLEQRFVETSNVNAVQEVTALISAQRAYEMNAKVITATDEMLAQSANLR